MLKINYLKTLRYILLATFSLFTLALLWYLMLALKLQPMSQKDIFAQYEYQHNPSLDISFVAIDEHNLQFSYHSFDGEVVYGQISYPKKQAEHYPVLIGISAMGRSYVRWWADSFNGNPTLTQVDKIAQLANQQGYVVVAIDARFHGKRKQESLPLSKIMNNLHLWGDRKGYLNMITNTVKDHRVLLDRLMEQTQFSVGKVTVAGYSMGGQISLLLASVDPRIDKIIAIAPPFINDKVAAVAPKNLVPNMRNASTLLMTASNDEYASQLENNLLFSLINSEKKQRIDFDSGHILPAHYVEQLLPFLATN